VTAYIARTGEPDTGPLLAELAARGVRVLQPVLRPDFDLDWVVDDGSRLVSEVHDSLSEPSGPRLGPEGIGTADLVLVPALAVDRSGMRLGHGGGCYDRALTRVAPGVLVVALLNDGEITDTPIPAEPHDRRVDAVATPSGVLRF
jgi:5-formyltetrahydrofolate cyclo-ligase